jgi:hypothetical protein
MSVNKEAELVPDFALLQSAEAAVNDEELTTDSAKLLIAQLAQKIQSLEDRVYDYEDTSMQYAPEQLPQT